MTNIGSAGGSSTPYPQNGLTAQQILQLHPPSFGMFSTAQLMQLHQLQPLPSLQLQGVSTTAQQALLQIQPLQFQIVAKPAIPTTTVVKPPLYPEHPHLKEHSNSQMIDNDGNIISKAKISQIIEKVRQISKEGKNYNGLMHRQVEFISCVILNNPNRAKKLLQTDKTVILAKSIFDYIPFCKTKDSALHIAVKLNNYSILQVILENSHKDCLLRVIDAVDQDERTPLMIAAAKSSRMTELLLNHGAMVEITGKGTAFHHVFQPTKVFGSVVSEENLKTLSLLLNKDFAIVKIEIEKILKESNIISDLSNIVLSYLQPYLPDVLNIDYPFGDSYPWGGPLIIKTTTALGAAIFNFNNPIPPNEYETRLQAVKMLLDAGASIDSLTQYSPSDPSKQHTITIFEAVSKGRDEALSVPDSFMSRCHILINLFMKQHPNT